MRISNEPFLDCSSNLHMRIISFTHPPNPLALTTMPFANGNLLLNQADGTATLGTAKRPMPNPVQMPWERSKCQYSYDSPCVIVPARINIEPVLRR